MLTLEGELSIKEIRGEDQGMNTEASMKKLFLFTFLVLIYFTGFLFPQTWSPPKRLTWNAGESAEPSIAADSGSNIHIAWYDDSLGNYNVFYKMSSDSGVTWSGIKRLTWNGGNNQSIAIDSSDRIHVVWQGGAPNGDAEIFYKYSVDGGMTWSTIKRLTWSIGWSLGPNITSDSGSGIHLVWYDNNPGNLEIFYKGSTDSGNTWSGLKRLTWNTGNSSRPSITIDSSGGIHVVWDDDSLGNDEIFYKNSTDGGVTWSGITRMTWNWGQSYGPSILADNGGKIHILWEDFPIAGGNKEIFYKNSSDGGITWSGLIRLTWSWGDSYSPSIAADLAGSIHVIWEDATPGNSEIFHKTSTDGGASWLGVTRLTWNSGISWWPSVATDSSNDIHVVWGDNTPGNYEIFYKSRK